MNIKEIEKIFAEYRDEMVAQSAWSAHAYAPKYLRNIYEVFRKVLESLKDNRGYAQYITADMFTDYDNLITKVYQSDNITLEEKGDISDIINEKFLDTLADMAQLVQKYYEQETGHELIVPED